jgi:hypothetical protein
MPEANHIRVILAANVTAATATRTMTKAVPIIGFVFDVRHSRILLARRREAEPDLQLTRT